MVTWDQVSHCNRLLAANALEDASPHLSELRCNEPDLGTVGQA